ncbi:phosphate ABC transporter permease PstA [Propionibacteriaceae bacterium Y1700]|uniref:phosphate ABC transporter permease PstA n=1 Tax=Microlunatus sp. Y1700 TaxID=3418487 RepID=UPI003DA75AF5
MTDPKGDPSMEFARPSGIRTFKNGLATVLVTFAALLALVPLVWILWSVISQGLPSMFDVQWWVADQVGVTQNCPSDPPRRGCRTNGGVLHAVVGTVMIGVITALIAVPLAVLGAIFLIEYGRGKRLGRAVSFMVDILSGVPSIVAALFIYAMVITLFGFGRSGIAAALALVLLMIPTVFRSTEEMLKLVPDSLREASYALGVPKWKTIVRVVVPTAFGGIATGVVLGLARVMGETAPLLILIGYATNFTMNPLTQDLGTLPTMINVGMNIPQQMPGYDRIWGAALTLIMVVMLLNLAARGIERATKLKER